MSDLYTSYDGKRVLVTGGGGAGMGAATVAELVGFGAEVHVLDIKEPTTDGVTFHHTDLMDRGAIDAALAAVGAPVDSLFYCAGLPGAPFSGVDTMTVNFLSMRYVAERVADLMTRGGAIVSISSAAGMGWMAHVTEMLALARTPDFDAGMEWVLANPELVGDGGYGCSKEAVVVWTMDASPRFARRGIRVNCTGPGCTDTPMMPQFIAQASEEFFANFPRPIENRNSTPEEQAHALIFLNSDAASYIAGSCLWVDAAFVAGTMTGQWQLGPQPADA